MHRDHVCFCITQTSAKSCEFQLQCLSLRPSHVCRVGMGQRTQPKTRASEVRKWTDRPNAGFPDRKTQKASRISRNWLQQSGDIVISSVLLNFYRCSKVDALQAVRDHAVTAVLCACARWSDALPSKPNDITAGQVCTCHGTKLLFNNLFLPGNPASLGPQMGIYENPVLNQLGYHSPRRDYWNLWIKSSSEHVMNHHISTQFRKPCRRTPPAPGGTGASAAWQASRVLGGALLAANSNVSSGLLQGFCPRVIFVGLWFTEIISLTSFVLSIYLI
jgi:hypothetical protein